MNRFCPVLRWLLLLLAVPSVRADLRGADTKGWLIVTEENPPSAIAENTDALRRELSELTRQPIPQVAWSSLTDQQRDDANLIFVGRYAHNMRAREMLDARQLSRPLESEADFDRRQAYVVSVCPHEASDTTTVMAIGWDVPGATYGISHLRTNFRVQNAQLYLAPAKPPERKTGFHRVYSPSFKERGVYYNLAWLELGRLTPLNWRHEDWEYWIDRLVCAQLTHVYFFLWSDSLYFPKAPVTADAEDKLRHQRLQQMIRYAHRRGLQVGYFFCPTQVPRDIFRANADTLKASIVYADHGFPVICPAVTQTLQLGGHRWNGAWQLMSDLYGRQIEYYREADSHHLWFYDPGGCFCGADKHDCLGQQAQRLMDQVDHFYNATQRVHPHSRFTISMWPVWALEPLYQVEYREDFLKLLSHYLDSHGVARRDFTVTDTLSHADTTLPLARESGFRTSGFIFPTNVESGCGLLIPMFEFLAETVRHGSELGVQAIYHMRIEEPAKFANTFFASRFYWNASTPPEDALREYVGWLANTNEDSAARLREAFLLLDRFMCDGADEHDHSASGTRIEELVELALAPLGHEKNRELEWLRTTGRAARLIGLAIDHPEQHDELAVQFADLMQSSPTFATCKTPLDKYVAWIRRGWSTENF